MDILKKVLESIEVMRGYKRTHRMIMDLKVFVAEDVYAELKKTGSMVKDITGRYFLADIPVTELKDYPKGYISVE